MMPKINFTLFGPEKQAGQLAVSQLYGGKRHKTVLRHS
jgi:hypothetical protein